MNPLRRRWYRRLQVQLWLWAIFPLLLALVAVTLASVHSHQRAMVEFVSERDTMLAQLHALLIEDAVDHGTVPPDGRGLSQVVVEPRVARRGVIYVVDANGRVLFHPDAVLVGADRSADTTVRQAILGSGGTVSGALADGSTTLASFAIVEATGWRVIVEEPIDDVIVPVLRLSSTLPFLLLTASLLSLVIIYFSFRTIVKPLRSLAQAASQATGGDLALPERVSGVEEVRDLHRALADMAERIRRYQASIHDYVDGIASSQEAERARLSRELHDQTVQDLVAITQRLQLTRRDLERGRPDAARDTLEEARLLCRKALSEIRRTIQALRPVYLDDLGFLPALEMLVQEVRQEDLEAEISVLGETRRLQPEVEIAAFRVAQEALSNAVRHARARHIQLTVSFEPQEVVLTIRDDGVGFAPPVAPDELTRTGHFGLVGMQERALLVHGQLHVSSEPGRGTIVTAHLPS